MVCPLTMVAVHGPLITTARGAKASGSDRLVSGPSIVLVIFVVLIHNLPYLTIKKTVRNHNLFLNIAVIIIKMSDHNHLLLSGL